MSISYKYDIPDCKVSNGMIGHLPYHSLYENFRSFCKMSRTFRGRYIYDFRKIGGGAEVWITGNF